MMLLSALFIASSLGPCLGFALARKGVRHPFAAPLTVKSTNKGWWWEGRAVSDLAAWLPSQIRGGP